MSVFVDRHTRVVVQGITGSAGSFHTEQMIAYGTQVVAGVTPGRGGTRFGQVVPVFETVADAVRETGANASAIFVPPPLAADAIVEAAEAGVNLIVAITEGIPVLDMVQVRRYLQDKPGVRLIGPNCPGVITPGQCKIGIMPGSIHRPGNVAIVSRSGTLERGSRRAGDRREAARRDPAEDGARGGRRQGARGPGGVIVGRSGARGEHPRVEAVA